LFCIS
jgi:hypothetical protein